MFRSFFTNRSFSNQPSILHSSFYFRPRKYPSTAYSFEQLTANKLLDNCLSLIKQFVFCLCIDYCREWNTCGLE
jgi:hypothetical protein